MPPGREREAGDLDSVERPASAPDEPAPDGGARYESLGEIGRGGMGRVVEARDRVLDRPVAIKESLDHARDRIAEFEREARLTARLQHPAIVPVYDAGRWPETGKPFYAMKLVGGRSLERLIAGARDLDERLALLPVVIAVADAVAYAHSQRVIHRDLKPANVLVGEFGETLVVDWGVALELGARDAHAGSVVGTPPYMPPEQACGDPLDERADVYALGATLYHLFAGVAPFDGGSTDDVIERVIQESPVPLARRQRGVPPELLAIVDKAMDRDPSRRYANASEIAADLKRFQRGQLVAAHAYSRTQLVARWVRRHRAAVAVATIAVLALATVGGVSVARIARERGEARAQRAEARRRTMDLLVEQGRQETFAGRGARAERYLAEAHRMGERSTSLRFLRAQAQRIADARLGALTMDARVRVIRFSPDGARILGGDDGGAMRIWDATTLEPIATWRAHDASIRDAGYGPGGERIVTAGRDRAARLWSADGAPERSLDDHDAEVDGARFLPDGERIATTTETGTVTIWDARTGAKLTSSAEHAGPVRAIAFSPDGAWIATGADDGTVRILAARDGARVVELDTLLTRVWSIAFSPDGATVAIGGERALPGSGAEVDVELWRAAGWERVPLRGHLGEVTAVAYAPDGGTLATASADQTVRLWDPGTGRSRATLRATAPLVSVAFSPDGTRLASGALDGTIQLWDRHTGALFATLEGTPSGVGRLAFSPDGARLVTVQREAAIAWDARAGALLVAAWSQAGAYASPRVFSPDGARLALPRREGGVDVWDPRAGRVVVTVAPEASIWSAEHTPDGERIVVGTRRGELSIFGARDGSPIATSDDGQRSIYVVTVDPSGSRIVTVDRDHHVRLWDAGGKLVAAFDEPGANYCPPRFDAAGRRFVTVAAERGERRGLVLVRDARDAREIARLPVDDEPRCAAPTPDGARVVHAGANAPPRLIWVDGSRAPVVFGDAGAAAVAEPSPDGARVVTGGVDGKGGVWDATTGARLFVLEGHGDVVSVVAFSPDGELIATGSLDRTVKIWDAADGRLLATFVATAGTFVHFTFAPDGSALFATDAAGRATVWDTRREARTP